MNEMPAHFPKQNILRNIARAVCRLYVAVQPNDCRKQYEETPSSYVLNIKYIDAFQVLKCSAVEEYQYGHHFALRERKLTVSFSLFAVFKSMLFDYFVKFFVKLINNEINFCHFMLWNHNGLILV